MLTEDGGWIVPEPIAKTLTQLWDEFGDNWRIEKKEEKKDDDSIETRIP